jgi:hypothetical protein
MNTIDVSSLSPGDVKQILLRMIHEKKITKELLNELTQTDLLAETNRIEAIVEKHFEEYEEIFKKLA